MTLDVGIERAQHLAIARVVGMAQHQRVRQRISECTDADLQAPPILHQRARIEADGVIDIAHGLARQREELGRRGVRTNDDIEEAVIDQRASAEPRQGRIDLRNHQRARQAGALDRGKGVGGEIGIARKRQARIALARGHPLQDAVHPTVGQRIRHIGVVEAGVAALRLGGAQHRA